MNKVIFVGWIARLLTIALTFINTRLLIELTGIEGLAVQGIIASLLSWFALLNLGLPAGNQNLISEWRSRGRSLDKLRHTITSLAILLYLSTVPLSVAIGLLVRHYLLVSYPFVSSWAVIIACLLMSLSTIGIIFNQMLYAEHRSSWPNSFPAITALGTSTLLLLLRELNHNDINLILALYFLPNAIVTGVALYKLRLPSRWLLDCECMDALWSRSRGYFLNSFLGTVTLGIDYLILSRLLDSSDLAAYNLSGKFFLVLLSIHAVLLTSAWTPISELFYTRKFVKLRAHITRLLFGGLLLGVVGGLFILFLLPELISLLAGNTAPTVPLGLAFLWLAYLIVRIWSDTFFTVLQSFGRTDLLNRYIPVQAVLSVLFQLVLGFRFGAEGVLAGILLSFVATCVWYLPWHSWRLIQKSY